VTNFAYLTVVNSQNTLLSLSPRLERVMDLHLANLVLSQIQFFFISDFNIFDSNFLISLIHASV